MVLPTRRLRHTTSETTSDTSLVDRVLFMFRYYLHRAKHGPLPAPLSLLSDYSAKAELLVSALAPRPMANHLLLLLSLLLPACADALLPPTAAGPTLLRRSGPSLHR